MFYQKFIFTMKILKKKVQTPLSMGVLIFLASFGVVIFLAKNRVS